MKKEQIQKIEQVVCEVVEKVFKEHNLAVSCILVPDSLYYHPKEMNIPRAVYVARRFIYLILRDKYDIKIATIAKYSNMTLKTIFQNIRIARQLIEIDALHGQIYRELKERIS